MGQGPAVDYGLGVATDGAGNSFLTGEFSADFKLGGAELQRRGGTDVYVAKFDENGALRWITQGGGEKGDNAYAMVRDAQGNLLLGGSFGGTARFNGASVTSPRLVIPPLPLHLTITGKFVGASITSSGGNDLYVTKLKAR